MTTDIQELIEQRPHLREPLELYATWQHFRSMLAEYLPGKGSSSASGDNQAYPRELTGSIFQKFVTAFDLPGEKLEPLRAAMEEGGVDFMRLPLDEVPAVSLPYSEEELTTILFLLSRPYFLALHDSFPLDGRRWEDGRCPACSARPVLVSIAEGPQRILHCSWCGTSGPSTRFTGCPNCGTGDTTRLSSLIPEEEKGFRVSACDGCRAYVKVVESPILSAMTVDMADLASLPLDIVAQGKGYIRRSPNPIGLRKME